MGIPFVPAHLSRSDDGSRVETRRYRATGHQRPHQRLLALRQCCPLRHVHTFRASVVTGATPAAMAIASSSSNSSAAGG